MLTNFPLLATTCPRQLPSPRQLPTLSLTDSLLLLTVLVDLEATSHPHRLTSRPRQLPALANFLLSLTTHPGQLRLMLATITGLLTRQRCFTDSGCSYDWI